MLNGEVRRISDDPWAVRARLFFMMVVIGLVLVYGWPTPWRYDHHNGQLTRSARIYWGHVEVMTDSGWVILPSHRRPLEPAEAPVTADTR